MLIDAAISGDRNVIRTEAEAIQTIKTLYVERKNHRDTRENRGNWNDLKITQKMPEQHTGKAGSHQGSTEDSHTGHSTHTAGRANAKVQSIQREKQHYMYPKL
jgi:hypothetical protein